jgi:hypothetical protein
VVVEDSLEARPELEFAVTVLDILLAENPVELLEEQAEIARFVLVDLVDFTDGFLADGFVDLLADLVADLIDRLLDGRPRLGRGRRGG